MAKESIHQVSDRIWTIPNVLSFIRLALIPVFLVMVVQGHDLIALLILIGASTSDFLDGWIARTFKQESRLGQLLDPAADRLYILAALLGLGWRELVPWWLVAVIVFRDILLALLGVVLANFGYGPLPVHHLGKVATFCLFYAMPVIMLGHALPATAAVADPIGYAFMLWGAFLYWWAGAIYLVETFRVIRIPDARAEDESVRLDS